MKQTINQIKVSEIADFIQRMDIDRDTMINLTIETMEDDFLTVFDRISKEAQAKGLTEEILAGLLANDGMTPDFDANPTHVGKGITLVPGISGVPASTDIQ